MSRDRIEEILARVRTWPKDWQDAAAFMLLSIEEDYPNLYVPTDEERADIEAGLAECERGEFATDEEVAAVFRRNR
jgi:predicted transcriptional regulator